MPIDPAAVDVLRAASAVLNRWGAWYLFGAQAVVAYGHPRLSADVDVTLRLDPDEPDRFARDMAAAGFQLRIDDPEFVRRTRVIPFVHVATAMPLDVVLAGSGLEDEFLAQARTLDIQGIAVPTLSPDNLIIAKILAARPKDIEDARGLWRIHGPALDRIRIETVLRLLEEALGQSDLLPLFESIRAR